jgi:hypothetical protein
VNAALTVAVILAMIAVGAWIINRLAADQHSGVAGRRRTGRQRPPGMRGPWLPMLPGSGSGRGRARAPRPPAGPAPCAAPGAVHHGPSVGDDRRDHRDGGRGR